MIKKYNQFVKENIEMAEPQTAPAAPDTKPETTEKPETRPRPTPNSPIPGERNSPIPAPAKAELDTEEEEEEAGEYYHNRLKELADVLGVEIIDNHIDYDGKKIIFPSETGKYHVDGKKLNSLEDVLEFLGVDDNDNEDKLMSDESEFDSFDDDTYMSNDDTGDEEDRFESKSYSKTRLRKFKK